MLGRFNGIDILFIALIGIYLIALIFLIFYLGSLFFDKADQKRKLAKTNALKLSLEKEETKEEVTIVKPVKTKNKSLVNEDKVETKQTKKKSPNETSNKTKENSSKNKTTNPKKENNATNKNNGYRQATKKKSNSRKKKNKKKNNNKRKKK